MWSFQTMTQPGSWIFNLGSMRDPETVTGGHAPMGYQELRGLYKRYRVHGVKYRITCVNESGHNLQVATVLSPSVESLANMQTVAERPYCKLKMVSGHGSTNRAVFTGFTRNAKILGITKEAMRDDAYYAADMEHNPSRQPYLHLYWNDIDAQAGHKLNFTVQFDYYTECFERIPLGRSEQPTTNQK